ncbi:NmrA family NAD(P)-binding protein [Chitinophaga sp. 22536]|uniref:NmrA family NAD(P)-binding protein n=1 Tax=unclassified Chitinophaga TaxID=2619133 RepID=UPI003F87C0DE
MKKTIALLGATGKVGSKISEILLKDGFRLKLIAQTDSKLKRFKDMGAEVIPADITDVNALTEAFRNADGAYVMTPPDFGAASYRVFQRKVGDAVIEAVKKSGIKYIVNLSSCGGHMHEGNGLIGGLAEQEVKLNQLNDVNVLHLRPAYFLDNTLLNAQLIKQMGINGTTADADHEIPMVATKDIAVVAAAYLTKLDFAGKSVRAILGQRNYSFKEITGIIGKAIGKPELQYIQFPVEQSMQAMVEQGLSADVAKDITGMENSLKTGVMNYEKRTAENTSPTSAEVFIQEVFLPLYNSL